MMPFTSLRRTVKPCDEIPVKMLTDEAVEARSKIDRIKYPHDAKKLISNTIALFNRSYSYALVGKVLTNVDRIIAKTDLLKYTVCVKGCAFCCDVPVDITLAEAQYIQHKFKHKIENIPEVDKFSPCPFSKNNICIIYPARPIACRTFFGLDHPKFCYLQLEHRIHSAHSNPFYATVTYLLSQYNQERAPLKDIRNYFK